MQETLRTPSNILLSEKKTMWYFSLSMLFVTLLLIVTCYVMTSITRGSYMELQNSINSINTSIQTVSSDRNIVIAKIIAENTLRPTIDLKNIVTQFRLAATKAGVQFDGFSIKDDTINTVLTASEGTTQHPDPVGVIINMMNAYAPGQEVFRIGSIKTITGDTTQRTTAIELRINPSPIQ